MGVEFQCYKSCIHTCISVQVPVVRDRAIKGFGKYSSRVCVTVHIKDLLPLIENSQAWCPGGRFPLSFIY